MIGIARGYGVDSFLKDVEKPVVSEVGEATEPPVDTYTGFRHKAVEFDGDRVLLLYQKQGTDMRLCLP